VADVRIESVSKYFGDFAAVREVSTTFAEGTVTVLLGPSGCGKTTLMRMIVGLEKPTTGRIYFGDDDVTKIPTKKRKIGMVFQYPVIYRGTSVARNLELPLIAAKMDSSARKKRIDDIAEIMGITDLMQTSVDRLDNAGRQKVAVAREVARQPEVLLFDEPITNVDLTSKLELKRALKQLFTELQQTIIYVTHDQTEAMSLADNIALMNNGRIVQFAPPRVIYDNPDDVFAGWFLGSPGMNFLQNCFVVEGTRLVSPVLAEDLSVNADAQHAVTLAIRPEKVHASLTQQPGFVQATVANKAMTIGGRVLMELAIQDVQFKAVVEHEVGKDAASTMWVKFPRENVHLFDAKDRVLDAGLRSGA
jgi:ABC-type sugar transport system ATPase subunit